MNLQKKRRRQATTYLCLVPLLLWPVMVVSSQWDMPRAPAGEMGPLPLERSNPTSEFAKVRVRFKRQL